MIHIKLQWTLPHILWRETRHCLFGEKYLRQIVLFAFYMSILWVFGCETSPLSPEFEPIQTQYIAENDTLRVIVRATDNDSETLTYYVESLPPGATFDTETQFLVWAPTLDQGDSIYSAVIVVSDGDNYTGIDINIIVIDMPTYDELITSGWQYFSSDQYMSAVATFSQAVKNNPTADALTALGWSYLLSDSLVNAEERFTQALVLDSSLHDARAGRAASRRSLQEYEGAIEDAREVLDSDATYEFSRNSKYNYQDLLIIIAQSAFAIADYPIALEAVNTLDPSTSISPDDSNTWIIADIRYNTYQEALLITIQKLAELNGS